MPRSELSPSSLLIPLVMFQAQGLYSQTKDVSIAVSGNRTITIAMKDGMPLPAEDRNIKIQVAGLGSAPDKADPTKRAIFWIFGFTQKDGPKISEVKIEEVYTEKPDRLVTTDGSPTLKKSEWSTHTESVVISESTTPWIYEPKNSVFMFRFTIQFEGGGQSILHQLSMFPAQAKAYLSQPIKKK